METRDAMVHFRLTRGEHDLIRAAALKTGMSVSALLRRGALAGALMEVLSDSRDEPRESGESPTEGR